MLFRSIEYSTTRGAKRGYVLASELSGVTPPSLPSIPTYSNFTSGTYGTSGLGQSDFDGNGYIFTINKTNSDLLDETKTNISTAEDKYASMDVVELYENLNNLEITQDILTELCTIGAALDTAGPSLSRYKSNTGEYLHHDNGSDMFSSSTDRKSVV